MAMEGNELRMRNNRWRRDTVAVTSDTEWLANVNVVLSHVAGTILRLRTHIERVDPGQTLSTAVGLWRSRNGGADFQVGTGSGSIRMISSAHYSHQDPCLNLFLGSGTIIDSDNGMHVSDGQQTAGFNFPAAPRRFESEWCLFPDPESEFVNVGDEFEFFVKRANGNDFEFSPLQIPKLIIVAAPPGEATFDSVALDPVATQSGTSLLPVADAPALVTLRAVAEQLGVSVQAVATADAATLEAMATQAGTTLEAVVSITGAALLPVTEGS